VPTGATGAAVAGVAAIIDALGNLAILLFARVEHPGFSFKRRCLLANELFEFFKRDSAPVRRIAFKRNEIKGISAVASLYVFPLWIVFDPVGMSYLQAILLRNFVGELRPSVGDRHVFVTVQFGYHYDMSFPMLIDAQPAMGVDLFKQLVVMEGICD
jgi:hypothetical protein